MRLKNKVAIITGAGSGIGRESALLFSSEGCNILVSDIDESGGNETVDQIKGEGGNASFCKADVSKGDDCRQIYLSHHLD